MYLTSLIAAFSLNVRKLREKEGEGKGEERREEKEGGREEEQGEAKGGGGGGREGRNELRAACLRHWDRS